MTQSKRPKIAKVRTGQGDTHITRTEFAKRFQEQFYDPAFDSLKQQIEQLTQVAWTGYQEYRKSPRTKVAGKGFADPSFELPLEWLQTSAAIARAAKRQRSTKSPTRVLLICGSSRSDQTCPGEMSKSFRMTELARRVFESHDIEVDRLDLSHEASQYGRRILPCKACVSTAMPLCNWPCSCYPNHAMGQVNDWMNELYPRFVAAHGIMIVTPVNWYQAPSALKLLIDRLVCADGGNPDPTSTQGKDPKRAKALEMEGWDYPRHLAGRAFAVVVHGDTAGVETLRRSLVDWLNDLHLIPSGDAAELDRYIGYYEPYATSHDAFDVDAALHQEVRNAAHVLAGKIAILRKGRKQPEDDLTDPRPK